MSASAERKRRQEAKASGTDKKTLAAIEAENQRKKSKTRWTVGSIVVALLVAVIILLNSNLFYTSASAVEIGDDKYTTSEFQYYYYTQYYTFMNQYGSYAAYFGLDSTQPLKSQECTMMADGGTWYDYFREQAISAMTQITAFVDYAEENGITLDEEDLAEVEEQMAGLPEAAETNGYTSVASYLTAAYGRGCDEDLIRKVIERGTLASKAYNAVLESYDYTAEELEAYYTENKDTYDLFSFEYYLVSADTVDEIVTDDEGNETTRSNVTEETMAAAKAEADAIAALTDGSDLTAALAEYYAPEAAEPTEDDAEEPAEGEAEDETDAETETEAPTVPTPSVTEAQAGSSVSGAYADWVKDAARVAGDTAVIEAEDSGYYIVKFTARVDNHYNLRQTRHILIMAEAAEDGTYTDEAKAAAQTRAQEIYDEWLAGDATEDSFAALADEYSEDGGSNENGGLYDAIYEGQMVTEFNDFVFDAARQPGDTGIVYGESGSYAGYHVMYYVGEADQMYSEYLAENALLNEAMSTWQEELLAGYTAETKFALRFAA